MLKEKLKQARKNAELTQKEVADKMGITQQQYQKWESGERTPRPEPLQRLAEIFNTTTDALKGRDDGLEDIINTLRAYNPTEDEKADIQALIVSYFKDRQ